MDSAHWKFALKDDERPEPPIPAILMTSSTTAEGELSLAICRTIARDSGFCILELQSAGDLEHAQTGEWTLVAGALVLSFADRDWVNEHVEEMGQVGQRMADRAKAWGVDSWGGVQE